MCYLSTIDSAVVRPLSLHFWASGETDLLCVSKLVVEPSGGDQAGQSMEVVVDEGEAAIEVSLSVGGIVVVEEKVGRGRSGAGLYGQPSPKFQTQPGIQVRSFLKKARARSPATSSR